MQDIIRKLKTFVNKIKIPEMTYTNHKKIAIVLSALILICLLVSTIYDIAVPVSTHETVVRIKQGDTSKTIALKLKQNRVIRSAFWFDILSRLSKSERHLKSGRYVFGGNINLLQTMAKIRDGRSTLIHLTIPGRYFSLYCNNQEQ